MTVHTLKTCALGGLGLLAASCTLGASDLPEGDNAAAVPQLLSDHLDFAGGVLIDSAVPGATQSDVRIEPLEAVVIVQPGETSILALGIDSAVEDSDPVAATLIEFGAHGRHVSVTRASARSARVDNQFSVDASVCSTLCRRTYPVATLQAFETESGAVGAHHRGTFTLDCTDADVRECAGSQETSAGTERPTLDTGAGQGSGDCIAGSIVMCECPDASVGSAVCDADGTLGACACAPGTGASDGFGMGGGVGGDGGDGGGAGMPGTAGAGGSLGTGGATATGGMGGGGGVGGAGGMGGMGGVAGGGAPSGEPFGQCSVDADCPAEAPLCYYGIGGGLCTDACASNNDCTVAPNTGTAPVVCNPSTGRCALDCGGGATCPDRMACADNGGFSECAYP